MMEIKAYTAFGEMGFGKTGFGETGRHRQTNRKTYFAYPMASIPTALSDRDGQIFSV